MDPAPKPVAVPPLSTATATTKESNRQSSTTIRKSSKGSLPPSPTRVGKSSAAGKPKPLSTRAINDKEDLERLGKVTKEKELAAEKELFKERDKERVKKPFSPVRDPLGNISAGKDSPTGELPEIPRFNNLNASSSTSRETCNRSAEIGKLCVKNRVCLRSTESSACRWVGLCLYAFYT